MTGGDQGHPSRTDLLASAVALVEADGWAAYSPLRLAREAGVGLAEACVQLPDALAVVRAVGRRADVAMLDMEVDELLEMTPKERLFELIMRRLEALEFARPALRRLREDGPSEGWLGALGNIGQALKRVVEASDATPPGLRRLAAGAALGSVYLRTGRVWLQDDTPDKAATMAELDKRLEGISRFLR